MSNIVVIKIYIMQMRGSFILVCKMVTLGRIYSLTLTPIHCKIINRQAVNMWRYTCTQKMHANDKELTSP